MATEASVVGPYTLTREIGTGSTCTVYLARHLQTKDKVALKAVTKSRVNADTLRRARQEVLLMQKLNHPGVVSVVDAFENDDYLFVAMEYLDGGELFGQLEKYGAFTEAFSRHVMIQMTETMLYVHSQGIAHRDLKLENVLLDKSLTKCKIADFGLSAQVASLDPVKARLTTVCGTPHYCSPEVFDKTTGSYDGFLADVWSLAVCLYIMLTGNFPFHGKEITDVLMAIRRNNPRYPSSFSPEVSDLLRKMFVVKPEDRLTMEGVRRHPWLDVDGSWGRAADKAKAAFDEASAAAAALAAAALAAAAASASASTSSSSSSAAAAAGGGGRTGATSAAAGSTSSSATTTAAQPSFVGRAASLVSTDPSTTAPRPPAQTTTQTSERAVSSVSSSSIDTTEWSTDDLDESWEMIEVRYEVRGNPAPPATGEGGDRAAQVRQASSYVVSRVVVNDDAVGPSSPSSASASPEMTALLPPVPSSGGSGAPATSTAAATTAAPTCGAATGPAANTGGGGGGGGGAVATTAQSSAGIRVMSSVAPGPAKAGREGSVWRANAAREREAASQQEKGKESGNDGETAGEEQQVNIGELEVEVPVVPAAFAALPLPPPGM